jgi:hypothetical protein
MKAMTWVAAALVLAFATGCNDRDRDDTAGRIDDAAEETGAETREAVDDAGDATAEATDEVGDAAGDVGDATDDAADDVGDAASDAGNAVKNAAEGAGDAVDDAPDKLLNDRSFEQRDEFGRDMRERLAALDRELTEAERTIGQDASEAQTKAVAAARDARNAAGRSLERLGTATEANWDALRDEIDDAVDAAEARVRELRPDVKPMGGTGGPS